MKASSIALTVLALVVPSIAVAAAPKAAVRAVWRPMKAAPANASSLTRLQHPTLDRVANAKNAARAAAHRAGAAVKPAVVAETGAPLSLWAKAKAAAASK